MNQSLAPYSDYKPAGLPWLDKVPAHWEVIPNRKIFAERKDRGHIGEELLSVTISRGVIHQSDLIRNTSKKDSSNEDKSKYKLVLPGDFAYNKMRMWQGAAGYSEFRGIVSPAYIVLAPIPTVNVRYYHYLMRTPALIEEFHRYSYGICDDQLSLRFEDFRVVKTLYPPLPEQHRIVAFLDTKGRQITRLLRHKRQLIKLLNEQKQALIHRVVTQGLDVNVPRKDSGIEGVGEVPAHWIVLANRHLFRETTRKYSGEETVQLSLSQRQGLIESDQMEERSLQTASFDNFKYVIPDDLVLNRFKAHLGVFFASTKRGIVTFHYGVFQPKRLLRSKYYELLYHTQPYCTIYAGVSNGMTVGLQNLSNLNFYKIKTLLPPLEEQDAILDFVEIHVAETNATISKVEREIGLIQEYRTRLIADIVTGQVDVRHLADAAGEVLLPDELELEDEEDENEEELAEAEATGE